MLIFIGASSVLDENFMEKNNVTCTYMIINYMLTKEITIIIRSIIYECMKYCRLFMNYIDSCGCSTF